MSEGKWNTAGGEAGQGKAIQNPQKMARFKYGKDINQRQPTEKEIKKA